MSRHAATEPRIAGLPRVYWLRGVTLLIGLLVVSLYLLPRIYNLVATPYRLDNAVVSANKYNPALDRIVDHEKVTLTAFAALDSMDASLADVLETDAVVAAQLKRLIGQIRNDLQPILKSADGDVGDLIVSLNGLTSRIKTLQPPVDGATKAVAGDRVELQRILDDASSTAGKVHDARVSAENGARSLSGR
ncbi:hypothetical protein EEB19_22640 [Gordonia sp. OPL2]|nr:hypothetical protein EEB19_22640 [Gordonia sp. OPL2]